MANVYWKQEQAPFVCKLPVNKLSPQNQRGLWMRGLEIYKYDPQLSKPWATLVFDYKGEWRGLKHVDEGDVPQQIRLAVLLLGD